MMMTMTVMMMMINVDNDDDDDYYEDCDARFVKMSEKAFEDHSTLTTSSSVNLGIHPRVFEGK